MAWLISALGAALALAGAVSLAYGLPYIRLDWGQAETVAGTVALSGGVVTMALGAVIFALRERPRRVAPAVAARNATAGAVERAAARLDAGSPPPDPAGPALDTDAAPDRNETIAEPPGPAADRDGVAEDSGAPTVVGRYESNGASYVLFSDGTIEVETQNGTHRFASMNALRDHIERQGAA